MKRSVCVPKPSPRAEKLKREAENCLSLAVAEHSREFAVDLIEEAMMLMRRARELSAA